ncbi:MAG TPA: hypothetical protein VLB82_11450 [Thermodesulfobacteriota bacterium]|nr:hypothetical protein [Thermodesulfobacteriota bacterium]
MLNKVIIKFAHIILIITVFSSIGFVAQQKNSQYKNLSIEEYKLWMDGYFNKLPWPEFDFNKMLTKDVLKKSYKLGNQYIINNQRPEGNFNYEFDFVSGEVPETDNQVRQAGAIWALALMLGYEQDDDTKKALDKGLEYFFKHTIEGARKDTLVISYPGDVVSYTNTVGLISLAIIDYFILEKEGKIKLSTDYKDKLNKYLDGYLRHLKSIRLPSKHFSNYYDINSKKSSDTFDPYADGETILAFIKAAKYLGHKELIPVIEESAIIMAKHYTYDQWVEDYDSPKTKGFFQWSCMAFWEYQDVGWKDSEFYRKYVVSLAWWMINVHKTLYRQANTGYVYEGVIPALLIARDMKRKNISTNLEYAIDTALYKLTTWQVGGPIKAENFFLLNNPPKNINAIGGIMNFKNNPLLRIDVTQHQMHAAIMALRHVYK